MFCLLLYQCVVCWTVCRCSVVAVSVCCVGLYVDVLFVAVSVCCVGLYVDVLFVTVLVLYVGLYVDVLLLLYQCVVLDCM